MEVISRAEPSSANREVIDSLLARYVAREIAIRVIGLGCVGLRLARVPVEMEFRVTGFDVDQKKVDDLNAGRSYIRHAPSDELQHLGTRRGEIPELP
jgi:UDP-N-acetyl-D-mannosaminuronate dehydrogenase